MRISLIVAMDNNGVIGHEGGMPWRLPADLRHFRQHTTGKPILMGRRTFESIGRPLPDRDNLVLTRQADFHAEGVRRVADLQAGVDLATGDGAPELMVIGGAQVYGLALPRADRLLITRVDGTFPGDTWFPAIDETEWDTVAEDYRAADDRNPVACRFLDMWRRHRPAPVNHEE